MMICPCADCENTEPHSMCINGMLEAEVSLARADNNMYRWIMLTIVFGGLAALLSSALSLCGGS
jgi:hypothetical protein